MAITPSAPPLVVARRRACRPAAGPAAVAI